MLVHTTGQAAENISMGLEHGLPHTQRIKLSMLYAQQRRVKQKRMDMYWVGRDGQKIIWFKRPLQALELYLWISSAEKVSPVNKRPPGRRKDCIQNLQIFNTYMFLGTISGLRVSGLSIEVAQWTRCRYVYMHAFILRLLTEHPPSWPADILMIPIAND